MSEFSSDNLHQRRAAELKAAFVQSQALLQADDRQRTLVVVDVQPGFLDGRHEAFLQSVEGLILEARAAGGPIIFLEYEGRFGPTYRQLQKLVEGYEERSKRVTKGHWSGAREVTDTCNKYGFGRGIFRVCGVYTDQCVSYTVKDLAAAFPRSLVEVVPAACRSYQQACKGADSDGWADFPLAPNIFLIPAQPAICQPAKASLALAA